MALNIGVNVVEVDGRAAPAVAAAPVSVAGFLLRTERGVLDIPVSLRGMHDFATHFGGVVPDMHGPHAVRGFFDNGGTQMYAVRVLDRIGSKAATVMLVDRSDADTLEISAGQRGREDRGAWGNALSVQVVDHPRATVLLPAQVLGSTKEPYKLTNGQSLTVKADGVDVTVLIQSRDFATIGAATATEVSAAVARQTTTFRAAATPGGQLLLAGSLPGPGARLEVSGSAAALLGFGAGNASSDFTPATGSTVAAVEAVGGLAVGSAVSIESQGMVVASAGIDTDITPGTGIEVTVDGGNAPIPVVFDAEGLALSSGHTVPDAVVAAINHQADGFSARLDTNRRLVLTSDSYGPQSAITVAAGSQDAIEALGLESAPSVSGMEENRTLTGVSEQARFISWSGGLPTAMPAGRSRVRSAEFDLMVSRDGQPVERFESLSMQSTLDWFIGTVVNHPVTGSQFVTVTVQASTSGPVDDVPVAANYRLGADGDEAGTDGASLKDQDFVGDAADRTGLSAFDTVDIQLLACPDTTAPGVVKACLDQVERRGEAMFVGAVPSKGNLQSAQDYAAQFRGQKVYGALYAPWIEIINPLDRTGQRPRLAVPPVGHVLGIYARTAEARGVWKAPAGDGAMVLSALGVEFDMTDAEHTDLVRNCGVNGIRAIPGSGIVLDASRTLSTDPRWRYVNVRRLFNFVKSSLRDSLRWVAQEPHSEELRRRVRFNVVTPFLLHLWRQGAFGSDPAEESFTVKCDAENNPPDQVNLGNFSLEVFFYPTKPVETILIVVGQQDSGAAAVET
ncbi:phage tail sheath C-terminal domain-containing protein [Streptomyces sp. NPDC004980]